MAVVWEWEYCNAGIASDTPFTQRNTDTTILSSVQHMSLWRENMNPEREVTVSVVFFLFFVYTLEKYYGSLEEAVRPL